MRLLLFLLHFITLFEVKVWISWFFSMDSKKSYAEPQQKNQKLKYFCSLYTNFHFPKFYNNLWTSQLPITVFQPGLKLSYPKSAMSHTSFHRQKYYKSYGLFWFDRHQNNFLLPCPIFLYLILWIFYIYAFYLKFLLFSPMCHLCLCNYHTLILRRPILYSLSGKVHHSLNFRNLTSSVGC